MTKKFFITSTGTNIGKTFVLECLYRELTSMGKTAKLLKPIASGMEELQHDLIRISDLLKTTFDDINYYRFNAALSPDAAAKLENKEISIQKVVEFCSVPCKEDFLLVEGVGGVMVPINDNETTLDIMAQLNFPAIMVVGSYLGSLSHTLTALGVLKNNAIPLQLVVISESKDSVPIDLFISSLKPHVNVPIILLPREAESGKKAVKQIAYFLM